MMQSILVFIVFLGALTYLVKVLRKEFSGNDAECDHCAVKKVKDVL